MCANQSLESTWIRGEFGYNSEKSFNNPAFSERSDNLKEDDKVDTKSKATILLTMVAVSALLGGIAVTAYATNDGEENSNGFPEWFNGRMMAGICGMPRGGPRRGPRGWGRGGFVEVSEEFEENVISIAESDEDVQALLDDGYSVAGVRPIIKSLVEADGNVETKAANAIVVLEKDETGRARAWVDLEETKVTKIVILTRTVIEKD